jgi:hypothetical protein
MDSAIDDPHGYSVGLQLLLGRERLVQGNTRRDYRSLVVISVTQHLATADGKFFGSIVDDRTSPETSAAVAGSLANELHER